MLCFRHFRGKVLRVLCKGQVGSECVDLKLLELQIHLYLEIFILYTLLAHTHTHTHTHYSKGISDTSTEL